MAKRWYVIHTYSGYENKVKADLEHRIETYGLEDKVVDIQIPTEEVTEIKDGGKRETKESKVFPSYVLVRMEIDDNTWAVVRNTPGVTGFVGLDGKPTPLRRDEFDKIMRRSGGRGTTASVPKRTSTNLEVGQTVRVLSGPLADFDGQISEVMAESGKVKVMLMIFGRETPVELTLDQISVIS
ncbi:transcription termination/antitermination protein NusG [Olsenella sp. An285]|uniref:transcription termination/antitermination protein NusG n=1 Tax=Olsenella sp. An285 TaxID=1965621 RepID=UPI000B37BE45|nr:transcription termination/antitermination protein NusG [Olsenella sp. An285]OUO46950.1 transcription termination/antitermination protein NusG [Olsenella sp. An285]